MAPVPLRLFALGLSTIAAVAGTTSAMAVDRSYSVTSFSRIRVEGPIAVVIETGRSPSAIATGDRTAVDKLSVSVSDGLLMIGVDRSNWTGEPSTAGGGRAILRVGTPSLASLSVIGAGDVRVDSIRGANFTLTVTGPGKAAVGAVDVDRLLVGVNGAGDARLGGKARQGQIRSQGNGTVDASALALDDADIALIGAGDIRVRANRSAKTMLRGSGSIVVGGRPACTGSRDGSGEVICGAGNTAP